MQLARGRFSFVLLHSSIACEYVPSRQKNEVLMKEEKVADHRKVIELQDQLIKTKEEIIWTVKPPCTMYTRYNVHCTLYLVKSRVSQMRYKRRLPRLLPSRK